VDMVCEWMRVGFVHGVMNTDNMSILGLTIDYGPYGWLDDYDPDWTPNTTDAAHRRYRFGTQVTVAQWNLMQLANALYPLIGEAEPLQAALDVVAPYYEQRWGAMMAAKLGLPRIEGQADRELTVAALNLLRLVETDMTVFWRRLATVPTAEGVDPAERIAPLADAHYRPGSITRTSGGTTCPNWPSTPPPKAAPRPSASCSTSCAAPTTSSLSESPTQRCAPTGPAPASAAASSPAVPRA